MKHLRTTIATAILAVGANAAIADIRPGKKP